jgi:Protein of unknown function (DUF1571)
MALVVGCSVSSSGGEVSAAQFVRALEDMERTYARVDHYTVTLFVQERMDGELSPPQWIALKFKKPFKVYLRWLDGPNEGRQVLFRLGLTAMGY